MMKRGRDAAAGECVVRVNCCGRCVKVKTLSDCAESTVALFVRRLEECKDLETRFQMLTWKNISNLQKTSQESNGPWRTWRKLFYLKYAVRI
jgi:hypothetical protein